LTSTDSKKWAQTVRSELVYHFNWGGGTTSATEMAVKAPVLAAVAYAPSWTGWYIGGGGGYGLWNQENTSFNDGSPRTQSTDTATSGGRGWFGTIEGGFDYQFAAAGTNFVVGAFGDYDVSDIAGKHASLGLPGIVANEKMGSGWAVGGRIGWVALPGFMTYFSGGYTEATFNRQDYTFFFGPPPGGPVGVFTDKRTYKGWFLGAGDEYALSFLPGLFWKNEYRFASFNTETNPYVSSTTGLPIGVSDDSKKWVQTIRTELVYRFNWGGAPLVAKY
jgi:outer membrane immunogenic protein